LLTREVGEATHLEVLAINVIHKLMLYGASEQLIVLGRNHLIEAHRVQEACAI